MQSNHTPARGTAVSAAEAEALSLTKPSQEPQHLQNHTLLFNLPLTISGLEFPISQDVSNESDGSTESSSDDPSDMDEESEPEDLELNVCLPQLHLQLNY